MNNKDDWKLCKDEMPEFNRECWITIVNFSTNFKPEVFVDELKENGHWRSHYYTHDVVAWKYREETPQPY